MAESRKIFKDFDPQNDDFIIYEEQLEQYFISNEIKTDELKVAVILSSISATTYKLLRSLTFPKKPKELKFEEVMKHLRSQYSSSSCIWRERKKFYDLQQEVDESMVQWYARLKSYASNCQFGNQLNAILRDKFICGLRSGVILDRLCELKEESTMEEVLEAARAKENLDKEKSLSVHAISGGHFGPKGRSGSHSKFPPRKNVAGNVGNRDDSAQNRRQYRISDNFDKNKNGYQFSRSSDRGHQKQDSRQKFDNFKNRKQCIICGNAHGSKRCRYINYKCRTCGKNHLERMCQKKTVNFMETEDEVIANIFNNNSSNIIKQDFKVDISILNRPVTFLIDSGSTISALSLSTYKQFENVCNLKMDETVTFKTYNNAKFKPLGYVEFDVTFNKVTCQQKFYVIEEASINILGRDWCKNFGISFEMTCQISGIDEDLENIFKEYDKVFSNKLGCFRYSKICLEIKEGAKPIFCRPRSVPLAYRHQVEQELERMQENGIISPINTSEWATPLVIVPKHDGSLRLCGDFKITINKHVQKVHHPLPLIEDMFAKMSGGVQFSKIDLRNAYTQFELDEDSKKLLTLSTHKGLFQVNRLMYGITVASGLFQKYMEQLFMGMDFVVCFLDDILITGRNKAEHYKNLRKVLEKLEHAGLTVNKDKCKFFVDSVEYLGHEISKNGLKKLDSKVKAICDAAEPKTVTEVRCFVGMVTYYARFIPTLAHTLKPIYTLLQKDTKFIWSDECSQAFSKIKELIAQDICLAHFDNKNPITLTTDASNDAVAAVLSSTIDGKERIIACASRVLNQSERRYSTIHKEALGIYFGARKFSQYLIGNHFTLKTDHAPLVALFGKNKGIPVMHANRLVRWAIYLSTFDFTMQHIKGKENIFADYISRATKGPVLECTVVEKGEYINFTESCPDWPINNRKIREETQKDIELKQVRKWIESGKWPFRNVNGNMQKYIHHKDNLRLESSIIMLGHRVVIPKKFRTALLEELHSAHYGIVKTKNLARTVMWWPGIDKDIEEITKTCHACLDNSSGPARAVVSWPKSEKVFERIHIDHLILNNKTFLIITDSYSKWIECYLVRNTSAEETIEKLYDCFSRYGIPDILVSDNFSSFVGEKMSNFFKSNGVKHITSPTFHPQSNGSAENAVKTFKRNLKCALQDPRNKNLSLQMLISKILGAYRSTPHCITQQSPDTLMFGRKIRTRLTQILEDSGESSQKQRKELEVTQRIKKGKIREFKEGEKVMVRDYRDPNRIKWIPGTIEKKISSTTYICRTLEGHTWKRHQNQLIQRLEKREDQGIQRKVVRNDRQKHHIQNTNISPKIVSYDNIVLNYNSNNSRLRTDSSSMDQENVNPIVVDVLVHRENNVDVSDKNLVRSNVINDYNFDVINRNTAVSEIEVEKCSENTSAEVIEKVNSYDKIEICKFSSKNENDTKSRKSTRTVKKPNRYKDFITEID